MTVAPEVSDACATVPSATCGTCTVLSQTARDLPTMLLLLAACAPEPGDATAVDTSDATADATFGPSFPPATSRTRRR